MINIQSKSDNLAFCGKNTVSSKLKGLYKRHYTLTKEERDIQKLRGRIAGSVAKTKGVDECREIIIRETLAGNFDYVKAFNEEIGKDLSKKAYSTIGK